MRERYIERGTMKEGVGKREHKRREKVVEVVVHTWVKERKRKWG